MKDKARIRIRTRISIKEKSLIWIRILINCDADPQHPLSQRCISGRPIILRSLSEQIYPYLYAANAEGWLEMFEPQQRRLRTGRDEFQESRLLLKKRIEVRLCIGQSSHNCKLIEYQH